MTLQRFFKKLRLKPGDALLLHNSFSCPYKIEQVMKLGKLMKINFDVPIIIADNKNDISRVPFEESEKYYLMAKAAKEGKIYEHN